jgi:hypothetical protein
VSVDSLEKNELCVINSWRLSYELFTSPTCWEGEFGALDGQTETVIFHRLQGLWPSKDLVICHSHSVYVRG